ncbi:thiamine transporter 1-like [Lampris incognitus]|uniref:thiamine transporter 1-like n=1 Tax=Lampris incognitus TaxID=2546036 RepID=UPI0024B5FD4B|nr:thiamine transporter 1-like [Lampris incognitus]
MEAVKKWTSGWGYPTTLLCIYGFFSTVKPLEPFLIPYLTGPDKNLTAEQVNNEILPVWTYSYLSVLVPVFLLTDWLRYKPVVVFQCLNLFVTTAMILWTKSVAAMQATEFFYGVVTASEVAYFSYIYSVVDLDRYRKATSYCRSVQLLGYTVGSVLGQLLVSFNLMSYYYILVLTLVLTSIALFTSCLLPMPQQSMFFHRRRRHNEAPEDTGKYIDGVLDGKEKINRLSISLEEAGGKNEREQRESPGEGLGEGREERTGPKIEDAEEAGHTEGCVQVLLQLWRDFLQCYSSPQLLYWSVWWAMATCGYNQTANYVQVLWEDVQPSQNFTIYNGGVEAISSLFSAATAYSVGFAQVNWAHWGELALGGLSVLEAAALFAMTFAGNIWVCYTGYIVFKSLYMLSITIAMFQIAADLSMERFALIFGANNFAASALQTIITSIVVDSGGLGLPIVQQFTIYSSYFSVIAIIFCLRGIFTIYRGKKTQLESTLKKSVPQDPDVHCEARL